MSSGLGRTEDTEASLDLTAEALNGVGSPCSGVLGAVVLRAADFMNDSVGRDVDSSDGAGLKNPVGSIEGVKLDGVDGLNGLSMVSSNEYAEDPVLGSAVFLPALLGIGRGAEVAFEKELPVAALLPARGRPTLSPVALRCLGEWFRDSFVARGIFSRFCCIMQEIGRKVCEYDVGGVCVLRGKTVRGAALKALSMERLTGFFSLLHSVINSFCRCILLAAVINCDSTIWRGMH